MTLKNYTLKYLSVALLVIIGVWAGIFYVNIIDEIYDSIDDGLDNYKMLIIKKAAEDSLVLGKTEFAESNYSLRVIGKETALQARDVYKDTSMYMTNEEDFEPVRMLTSAFALHGTYYELKVISSMVEEDDLIEDLLYSVIWLYVALIISIVLINNLLLRKIWNPFYLLLGQLKQFRLHKETGIAVPVTKIDEFNKLNDAVKLMIKNAVEAYSNQKQFIENASHELQTPLAISINKLELMAEKEQAQASVDQIASVIETLERLTRLNKSLLLLSKIENRQFDDKEPVDINALCRQLFHEFDDFAAFKTVSLHVLEHEQLTIETDKGFASILISNLLKNAILHNIPNGTVDLELYSKQLVISNTGADNALDEEKIFERFHKNSPEKNTTGLGLAIVKAIAGLYHIHVQYNYTGNRHVIQLTF